MKQHERPISPDLQIYRPQLTSVLSISHRLTGLMLSIGSLLLVCWLISVAMGPSAYAFLHGFFDSWLGLSVLFCWTFSFFFHLCNGIRHLFWDAGYGFDLQTIYASGWIVVITSLTLSLTAWLISLYIQR